MSAAEELAALSEWIDDSYGPLDPEAHLWRRVSKCAEEVGEVFEALGGFLGENPRKGVTHTRTDLVAELLDTAVAALGAVEHLTGNQGQTLVRLDEHIHGLIFRARAHGAKR